MTKNKRSNDSHATRLPNTDTVSLRLMSTKHFVSYANQHAWGTLCLFAICAFANLHLNYYWIFYVHTFPSLSPSCCFSRKKQSQSHTLTHSHSCQELARLWVHQGNSLPSWILIDQSSLILAFYLVFRKHKKKFHSLQLAWVQEHLEFRQRLWRISKHSKTRLQLMEHEAAMEDESQWCSELQDWYAVLILTSVSDSQQNSSFKWGKQTDTWSIMSLVFWLRKRLSFLVGKHSFRPQLDHEQRLFNQTEATLCLLFCVNPVDLYSSTLSSIQVRGRWIQLDLQCYHLL